MIRFIFSPSTSIKEGLDDYEAAEKYGKIKKNCKKYVKRCSISLLSLFTWVENL